MILFSVLFLVVLTPILCSLGDMDPEYRHCVFPCYDKCEQSTSTSFVRLQENFKLVEWDCYDTCKYKCMTEVTKARLSKNYNVLKYYGHWPFNRYCGLEEPASVVFSALNFVPHLLHIVKTVRYYFNPIDKSYYMTESIFCYASFACNAWIASTLFHSKKSDFATQYDYISAFLFLSCGLWVSIRRYFGPNMSPLLCWSIVVGIVAACVYRVNSMIRGKVSFDSHMQVCISIVVVTTTIWLLWCLQGYFRTSGHSANSHRWICLACQLWLIAASALEIFDFPPYFELFDAHSLWHAATIPLGFIWYDWFWRLDCAEYHKMKSKIK